ncbi:TRAP transporter small permease [Paenibacillus sp. NPDC057967]|uniref:TRAP transporter small permease n=1 Tax=Paenibacillus sp. NPDC057967 TaxID=3346293 RepID=UPI0036D9B2A6
MKAIIKGFDVVNKLVGYIVGTMLMVMSVLVIVQIISRFVVDVPIHWTEELARYLMIYTVFLGAALALRHHKLIAVEVLAETIKPKPRKILKIAVMLITIVFMVILTVKGFEMMPIVSKQTSSAMGMPMSMAYMAIPIGAILMIMNAIVVIMEFLTNEHVETSEAARELKAIEQQEKGEQL